MRTDNKVSSILEERAAHYGDFKNVANVTEHLTRALDLGANSGNLDSVTKLAFYMICNKMARAVCGKITEDTIRDIQGYATLILEHSPNVVRDTYTEALHANTR